MFAGPVAALATRHAKDALLAPALEHMRLHVVVADVDTDAFGTFAGDVERPAGAATTAILKARAGLAAIPGASFGLASEGTFTSHPTAPHLALDDEIVALVSRDGSVWQGRWRAVSTAHAQTVVAEPDEAVSWALARGFPEQGVLVTGHRAVPHAPPAFVRKDLDTPDMIRVAVGQMLGLGLVPVVRTDLRAHRCPTRRDAIRLAALDLAERLATPCPACGHPGFGPDVRGAGLPWERTGAPAHERWACLRCGHAGGKPSRPASRATRAEDPRVRRGPTAG